jgi:hypothetical protein
MFDFDPAQYADFFAREGYVHIPGGVTEAFYRKMARQVEHNMRTAVMKEFAIGDKQQAMYQFPDDGTDYAQELCGAVGRVCGINPDDLVLSERHVKAYDADAAPEPNAHKDRFASQISVGLSVHVREGSTLVLYPYDELEINPFNTSVQLRASLSPDRYPEPALRRARRVEIKDAPRDVIIFRGHRIWHLRANPGHTTMLYFKLNALNCDPLGEDRRTPELARRTQAALDRDDAQLARLVPMVGRRVDFIHRLYNRDWREVIGVVLWGEKHFTIDEDELAMLRAMDGRRTVGDVAAAAAAASGGTNGDSALSKVRRLARRGVIDLLQAT